MENGINNFLGQKSRVTNPVMFTKGIVEDYVFIDIAKVIFNKDNRIDCQAGDRMYTNVEVLVFGINGYGIKFVPDAGDRVLILAPRTPMKSVEEFTKSNTMNNYDCSGLKAVPLTDKKASQLLTLDKTGVKLSGENKLTLNKNGITIEDKNRNKVEMTSSGIKLTSKDNSVVEIGKTVKIMGHLEIK